MSNIVTFANYNEKAHLNDMLLENISCLPAKMWSKPAAWGCNTAKQPESGYLYDVITQCGVA